MIELKVFGAVDLSGPDGREVRAVLTQPKRLAVLAYLAAGPPRFVRRDTLLALFWPELDQEHARAALRQTLHGLRQALGADAVEGRGEDEVRVSDAAIRCDVRLFESALAGGDLATALALYRGDLLDGFFLSGAPEFERWLETERGRLRRMAREALRTLSDGHRRDGRWSDAVAAARRGLALDPDDEGLLRLLITALDASGDRAGALKAYDDFARRVALEYGSEPAVETQSVLASVRARQLGAAAPEPAVHHDAGEVRMVRADAARIPAWRRYRR